MLNVNLKSGFSQMVGISVFLGMGAISTFIKFSTSVSESYMIQNFIEEAHSIDLAIHKTTLQYDCLPGVNCSMYKYLDLAYNDHILSSKWRSYKFERSLTECENSLREDTNHYTRFSDKFGSGTCIVMGLLSSGNLPFKIYAYEINDSFNPLSQFAPGYSSIQSNIA